MSVFSELIATSPNQQLVVGEVIYWVSVLSVTDANSIQTGFSSGGGNLLSVVCFLSLVRVLLNRYSEVNRVMC